MRALTTFQCELCNTQYADRTEAKSCEEHHIQPKALTKKMKFHSFKMDEYCQQNYPDWIEIEMENGAVVRYQR